MDLSESLSGHSTADALRILHDELLATLREHQIKLRHVSWFSWFRKSFLYHSNVGSVLHWTSILFVVIPSVILIISFGIQDAIDIWLAIEALVLLAVLVLNVYFVAWDDKLKQYEHISKSLKVFKALHECIEDELWDRNDYVSPHCPLSPCVTVQWTLRDCEILNIPCGFLVEGDVILLRPGQVVPARCKPLGKEESESYSNLEFTAGDLYNPWPDESDRSSHYKNEPMSRIPLRPQPFLVLETPFVRNFKSILERSLSRPPSLLNNERFCVFSTCIERKLVPLVLLIMLLTNMLRYFLLKEDVGHWTEMVFVLPIQSIVPLLPLTFPILWKMLDYYGTAKIVAAFDMMKKRAGSFDESEDSFQSEGSLTEDIDLSLNWDDIKSHFLDVLSGRSDTLPRSSNVLHAFGNVTSFTCVDKKGVLSWPNPTAEKVFFLTTKESAHAHHTSKESHMSSSGDSGTTPGDTDGEVSKSQPATAASQSKADRDYLVETAVQVLDLTQDSRTPYDLHFDDPMWKSNINSLKPLGLDILLNTCNMLTADRYTEFADHVTCASLKREGAVSNMNRSYITVEAFSTVRRRCFCELARQIGFNNKAVNIFDTEQILGMYRHVPQQQGKDKTKNTRSFIKYKMPMPNMFSVLARDKNTGMLQLFSHGTADLVLDACSDFWDGRDLCPLSEVERKKIYDFYHRTSMSSYCTAFSYRPLSQNIRDDLNDVYIEVPESNRELFPMLRSPTPTRSWDVQSLDSRLQTSSCLHTSLDSLMLDARARSVQDIPGCFRSQCNQIFVGMITMQYQAKQDIVELIEDLDSACIRFVHFSKENELRSRVFSEKMGLEAGWNCHISLLSERDTKKESTSQADISQNSHSNRPSHHSNRHSSESINARTASHIRSKHHADLFTKTRRSSAPGAINTETPQVKFEENDAGDDDDEEDTSYEGNTLPEDEASAVVGEQNARESRPAKADVPRAALKTSKNNSQSLGSEALGNPKADSDESVSITCEITDPLLKNEHNEDEDDHENKHGTIHRSHTAENRVEWEVAEPSDMGCVEPNEAINLRCYSTESFPASSYVTENTDSMTGVLGLSNRAKLPKGIENIRPHIENVDNVPLLVSLFTDCTSKTAQEMFEILQEHGEVVCCLGSSANIHNTDIFLQADCSISTEPLYPQICMRERGPVKGKKTSDLPMPMTLSSQLHSIPCSLSFHREDSVSIIRLIALSRHHCQRVRNTFLMLLMCQLGLTLLLMLNSWILLPPCLSPHLLMWLVCLVMPVLSLTMMGNPLDLQIVKMAQGKNKNHLPRRNFVEFVCHFFARYLPSLLICLLCHGFTLAELCKKVSRESLTENVTSNANSTISCHVLLGKRDLKGDSYWNGLYDEYKSGLTMSQNLVALQLVIYFICGSFCFVHRLKHLWQKSPFRNKLWCIVSPIVLCCQIVYFVIDQCVVNSMNSFEFTLADIPLVTWLTMLLWPLVLIPGLELLKYLEIKSWVRYQKRARLDFGTKLGMNSPF